MSNGLEDALKRRWKNRSKISPYIFCNDDGLKITYHQKSRIMKELCKKAEVKHFGFHAIRHHVASVLSDSGKASIGQIQKLLRHRKASTTDIYLKTLDPELKQVVEVLDGQIQLENENKRGTLGGTI